MTKLLLPVSLYDLGIYPPHHEIKRGFLQLLEAELAPYHLNGPGRDNRLTELPAYVYDVVDVPSTPLALIKGPRLLCQNLVD